MFGDSEITDDSIRSDGNSVCFEVAGDDENILYIFFPEEESRNFRIILYYKMISSLGG